MAVGVAGPVPSVAGADAERVLPLGLRGLRDAPMGKVISRVE
ncbi:hypothetical protein [Chelatococcus asaccharovorans]|nr:hypothetical protein [Chelatococcus asaccharovorans]